MPMRLWLLALVATTACVTPSPYQCATSTDCGTGGTCALATDGRSYCALPATSCAGGLAFGPQAGGFHGVCVTAVAVDASTTDAAATDAEATDAVTSDSLPIDAVDASQLDAMTSDASALDAMAPDTSGLDASDGPGPTGLAAECIPGAAIPRATSQCPAVCDRQPSCCTASWTRLCVQHAEVECHLRCSQRVAFASTGAVDVYDLSAAGANAVSAAALPAFGVSTQYYLSVAWADFNRDGTAELLVTADRGTSGTNDMWVLHPGVSWQTLADLSTFGAYRGSEVNSGDYDHDGRPDVIISGLYPGLRLVHGRAPGVAFEAGAAPPSAVQEYFGSTSDVGDYDNDGDDDIVVMDYWMGHGRIVRWASDRFEAGPSFGPFETPRRVTFGDVDGDFDLDLAIADNDYVRVVRTTAGQFEATPIWQFTVANAEFTDAAWIDIDGDRDLDLAVVEKHFDGGPVRIFENTGTDLTDQPIWTSVTLEHAWKLAVGDVDADGDLDLVVANEGMTNKIYLNNGDRTFRIGWQAAAAHSSFGVALTAR